MLLDALMQEDEESVIDYTKLKEKAHDRETWRQWERTCLWAENTNNNIAARCEKLAQGFYTAATWPGIEPRIYDTLVRLRRSTSKSPSHQYQFADAR